jgi:hypothetical protein
MVPLVDLVMLVTVMVSSSAMGERYIQKMKVYEVGEMCVP